MVTVRRQLQWWLPKRDRRRAEGASTLSWRLFWGFREGDFTFPPRKAGKNPRFSSALTPSPADGRPEERAPAEEAPPQRRRGGTRARPAPPAAFPPAPSARGRATPGRAAAASRPCRLGSAPPVGRRGGSGARPRRLVAAGPLAPTFVQPRRPSRVGGETPCEGRRHLG